MAFLEEVGPPLGGRQKRELRAVPAHCSVFATSPSIPPIFVARPMCPKDPEEALCKLQEQRGSGFPRLPRLLPALVAAEQPSVGPREIASSIRRAVGCRQSHVAPHHPLSILLKHQISDFSPSPLLLLQNIWGGAALCCSWQGPRLRLGKRTSAGRRAKRRAVGLLGCTTLVIKRAVWGKSGKPPCPRRRGAMRAAANHTRARARVRARLRRRAPARGGGRARGRAVHLPRQGLRPSRQPLTSNLSLSRLKGDCGKGRLPLRLFRA